MKDWKISGAIVGCSCNNGCSEARRILEDPMKENGYISGVHAIANSHLSRQLTTAAAKLNSGFTFQQLSSRAARVQGRVSITKNAAGRTPVAQLRNAGAAKAQRDAQLVPLRQLEEISDEISAPSKDQPVVDSNAYVALLAALRTGAAAADGAVRIVIFIVMTQRLMTRLAGPSEQTPISPVDRHTVCSHKYPTNPHDRPPQHACVEGLRPKAYMHLLDPRDGQR